MELENKIDVVIPIYNAYNVLFNCLTSLETNQHDINKVYLINDASTDQRIIKVLQEFSLRNNWKLINHEINKGFVKTANEGMKLSNNHTLLLNSDTVVTKHWVAAFKQSIKHNIRLGTATAWSNNAEICSFPEFLKNNKKPINANVLSEILYNDYEPRYPLIPTAVGFCMLITQQAQEQVGYFDEAHFGHGYGEENDYSLRVSAKGLTNILCDNAYVIHLGNESFGELGLKPNESTMTRLLQKHPNYNEIIQQYIKEDPLNSVRITLLNCIKNKNNKLFEELTNER